MEGRGAARGAGWVLVLALAAVLSWGARATQHRKVPLEGSQRWTTTDPDSLHMLRRAEGVFRHGLPPAGVDPDLSWPEGAALPAPPYYPVVMHALLAPFAPQDPEMRRGWLEERGCTLPALFGVAATVAAGLAGFLAAGLPGAAFVAASHALAPAAIQKACVGNGDYHAFATLLSILQLLALAWVLRSGALQRRPTALAWGAGVGTLHGLAIGTWTPALIFLALTAGVLALVLLTRPQSTRRELPLFALALHGGALLALLPGIAASPWTRLEPWSVTNLSLFHGVLLAAAMVLLAPLALSRPGERAERRYVQVLLGLGLAAVPAILLWGGPLAAALRSAVEWITRRDAFMAHVDESRPLVGPGTGGAAFLFLGYGVLAAPVALAGLVTAAWRGRRADALPWMLALLLFGAQAAVQQRFAELAVVPLAVGLAWTARLALERTGGARSWRVPAAASVLLAVGAAALLHARGVASTVERARAGRPFLDAPAKRAARTVGEWMRANTPPGAAVLALWSHGDALLWGAERPVVASGYGTYVGREGYLDAHRFFATSDPAAAEALLARRQVRYVLLTSDLERQIGALLWIAGEPEARPGAPPPVGLRMARAAADPSPAAPAGLDFLRVVHLASVSVRRGDGTTPQPAARLYERVAGARLRLQGEPGEVLEVALRVQFPGGASLVHRAAAPADAQGWAAVRIPYSSERAGDGQVAEGIRWRMGARSGSLHVPEEAVLLGSQLALP